MARMWKAGLGRRELKKCILVCKNCHFELHHKEIETKHFDCF